MDKRATYADVGGHIHRFKAVASLLNIGENALRASVKESGIDVPRANALNPKAPAVQLYSIPKIFEVANYRRERHGLGLEGKKPVIIAVEIIKGGTAKTTTAAELTVHLQLQGLKVLAIDLDVQANLTHLMGYESDIQADELDKYDYLAPEAVVSETFLTVCRPYIEEAALTSALFPPSSLDIKRPYGEYGPALIPSDIFLGDLERDIVGARGPRETFFRRFFADSAAGKVPALKVSDYDVIVLDCPPHTSYITTNAIALADIIIAPVRMEAFSVKGLSKLIQEIHSLRMHYPNEGIDPELLVLPTYFTPNLQRNARMQATITNFHVTVAPIVIAQSEEFPKSLAFNMPLSLIKPRADGAKQYQQFATLIYDKAKAIAKAKAGG